MRNLFTHSGMLSKNRDKLPEQLQGILESSAVTLIATSGKGGAHQPALTTRPKRKLVLRMSSHHVGAHKHNMCCKTHFFWGGLATVLV